MVTPNLDVDKENSYLTPETTQNLEDFDVNGSGELEKTINKFVFNDFSNELLYIDDKDDAEVDSLIEKTAEQIYSKFANHYLMGAESGNQDVLQTIKDMLTKYKNLHLDYTLNPNDDPSDHDKDMANIVNIYMKDIDKAFKAESKLSKTEGFDLNSEGRMERATKKKLMDYYDGIRKATDTEELTAGIAQEIYDDFASYHNLSVSGERDKELVNRISSMLKDLKSNLDHYKNSGMDKKVILSMMATKANTHLDQINGLFQNKEERKGLN